MVAGIRTEKRRYRLERGIGAILPGVVILFLAACGPGPGGPGPGGPGKESEPTPTPAPVFKSLSRTPLPSGGSNIISATSVLEGGTGSISVDPSSGRGSFSFQRNDLKLEFGQGKLPDDFPTDIPTPFEAKIVSVLHGPGLPTQVLFEVPMDYTRFRPRYEADLWRSNWKVLEEKAISKATGRILICRKDSRDLTVTLKETGTSTLLTLRLGQAQPAKPGRG